MMKNFYLTLCVLFAPLIAMAGDITQCRLSFHSVGSNDQITANPYLDHRHVKSIESRPHRPSGKQGVYVTFTQEGARINKAYTEKNIGKYIAIYCDGELLSKPRILGVTEHEVVFTLD